MCLGITVSAASNSPQLHHWFSGKLDRMSSPFWLVAHRRLDADRGGTFQFLVASVARHLWALAAVPEWYSPGSGGHAWFQLSRNPKRYSGLPAPWLSPRGSRRFRHSCTASGAKPRSHQRMAPVCFGWVCRGDYRRRQGDQTRPNIAQYLPNKHAISTHCSPIQLGRIGPNTITLGILRLNKN
jgi:hypothetical protein